MKLKDLNPGDRFRFDTTDEMARSPVHTMAGYKGGLVIVSLFCDPGVTSLRNPDTEVIFVTSHPTLYAAAKYILYDNGMIHRGTTEQAEITEALARAARVATPEELSKVEAELAALTGLQLYEVCCDTALADVKISDLADRVLNALFEEP